MFRQDLRVQDNTALTEAVLQCKELLCLFVFDEDILSQFSRPDGRIGFLRETIKTLRSELVGMGSDICIAHGTSVDIIATLIEDFHIDALFRNRSYGN